MPVEIWVAIIGAVAAIAAAAVGLFAGRQQGGRGHVSEFDRLETELVLDKTAWRGCYESTSPNGSVSTHTGTVKFRQYGSRITGVAQEGDREWFLEGLAYKGRLCYVYVDQNSNVTSIGTSSFELQGNGLRLVGTWAGWSPEGQQMTPHKIELTKIVT